MANLNQRLFVGNLPSKISESDVRKKLSRFGDVQSVEMKQRSDSEGNLLSSFAFVDIAANENDLKICFQYFEKELWHRQKVKVQLAKESFLDRLKRERKSSNNVTESPMKTSSKNFPVGVFGESKTVKSLSPHDRTGREKTPCTSKDNTPLKKKSSRIRGEDVSPVQVCSSKSGSAFSSDGSVLDKMSNDCPGTNSRVKGLPMFGGSKIIVGVNDASDNFGGIECQKTKNWSAKSFKSSTPNDVNNLSRRSLSVVNMFEDLEDSCALEAEDVPKRKNLPMFCGSKALIDLDNSTRENSLCNSANLEVKKQEGSFSRDSLGSSGNQLLISEGTMRSRFNPQNLYPADQNSRNAIRNEGSVENNEIISVMPSKSDSKQYKSPLGKKSITNDSMAERKRLNALEEKKKAFALQKEAVKKALSNIDLKNCANKKIIFNDDDDEVPDEEKACSTHSDKLKPKLFLDESDDEDIKNLESTEFKIKPQFEGRQGQKLLEIQSRYGHDSRFMLDERFLESDEDGSNIEQPPSVEEDLNAEKDHQLNILKEMIGVDISERRLKRDKKEKMNSLQMIRFDPTNPEHNKYLVKEEDLKKTMEKEGGEKKGKKHEVEDGGGNPSKKAKRDEEVQEEHVPVVIERFYKVSDKLKESLKKRTTNSCGDGDGLKQDVSSGGFSLLQKFGSPPSDNEEEEVEYSTKTITRSRNEWEKNPFRYDSSDDDEPEAAEQNKEELEKVDDIKAEEPSHSMKGAAEKFYFQENDPRLQEGLDFFGIKKTFSEMQEGFHERRADLKLIIKAKVRNNKRKNRPLKKKLGGARKHKKKMAAYGSKR